MKNERSEQIIKIARVLTINGEIDRKDITDMFWPDNIIMENLTEEELADLKKKVEARAAQFLKYQKDSNVLSAFKYKDKNKTKYAIRGNLLSKNKSFQKLLMDLDPMAWERYIATFKKSQVLKTTDTSMKRHCYIGHCLAFIMDDFDIDLWKRPTLSELAENNSEIPVNTFFEVREVKNVTDKAKQEFVGSTCTGVFLLPDGIHMMYYLPELKYNVPKKGNEKPDSDKDIKTESNWTRAREERFWTHVNQAFRGTAVNKDNELSTNKVQSPYIDAKSNKDNVLVLGSDEVALSIIKGFMNPQSKTEYVMTQNLTKKIVYIRDNHEGKQILKYQKVPELKQKVMSKFFKKSEFITSLDTEDVVRTTIKPDGKTERTAFIFWLDGDLSRLYRSLIVDGRKIDNFVICCPAPYSQLVKEIVEVVVGDKAKYNIEIKTISVGMLSDISEGR